MMMLQDAPAADRTQHLASAVRTLLVHVEPGAESAPRLDLAVSLAKRLDATLIGVGAEMIQSLGVADPFGLLEAQWIVEMRDMVRQNLKRAEAVFETKAAGLDTQWRAFEGIPAPTVAWLSRGADLVIAGGGPTRDRDSYKTADAADLVMTCGRPVLIAPPTAAEFRGHAVVVAWKDTREARRALGDALPFLKAAADVLVLEVCEDDTELADAEVHTADVVEHLKRHGVAARADVVAASAPTRVAGEIDAAAEAMGADLIVAGGYGHSRMSEWVFGGVTRSLLFDPSRFVLLSH